MIVGNESNMLSVVMPDRISRLRFCLLSSEIGLQARNIPAMSRLLSIAKSLATNTATTNAVAAVDTASSSPPSSTTTSYI